MMAAVMMTAQEQAAAMMADAYSRIGPNFGATMSTSGPGATNLITGICCSWFDSIPVLHISGQVNTYEQRDFHASLKNVRQVGFQETDIVSITNTITKFSKKINDKKLIKFYFEKSYNISQDRRQGPVLIDLPMGQLKLLAIRLKVRLRLGPDFFSSLERISALEYARVGQTVFGSMILLAIASTRFDNILSLS